MSAQPPPAPNLGTALLDALMARGLSAAQSSNPEAVESATPLEGYPSLPNPDPNSPPPLYGEPPGEGYLYAKDPATRQAALVETTPDFVRKMILRSMEVVAQNTLLPFNEEGAAKNADAMLKMAQAYLLIDPAVDAEGVPVAGKAMAQAAGQIAVNSTNPANQQQEETGETADNKAGEAHGTVKAGAVVGGMHDPPRVVAGHAAEVLQGMHENLEELLKGARGSRPLPKPRPSA